MSWARGAAALAGVGVVLLAASAGRADHPERPPAVWSPGPAVPRIAIRVGEHQGFSRVVFDLPAGRQAEAHPLAPDRWEVRVSNAVLAGPAWLPSRVRGLDLSGGAAVLIVAPGCTIRRHDYPGELVLDVVAAPPAAGLPRAALLPPAAPPPVESPALMQTSVSRPLHGATGSRHRVPGGAVLVADARPPASGVPADARLPARPATPSPVVPVVRPPSPLPSLPPTPAASPPAVPQDASPATAAGVLLPFGSGTGAAAFRRGDWAIAVFDERRPIDAALLGGSPALAPAVLSLLPDATILRLRLPPTQALRLSRERAGWRLAVADGLLPVQPIDALAAPDGLALPTAHPGRALTIPDEETGGLLLVGTTAPEPPPARRAEGVTAERRMPMLTLLSSWMGVAVVPHADDLTLRPTRDGFRVDEPRAAPPAAPVGNAAALADSARLTRSFDLPPLSVEALRRRLQVARAAAGAAPAQARGPARLDAAEAMVALGMGAEAGALVDLAVTDDPRLAGDERAVALGGVAGVLAGRLNAAARLDDPMLGDHGQPATDEIALWRGLRAASVARAESDDIDDGSAGAGPAAEMIGPRIGLLDAYPAPLRSRLLPLAVETLVQGGRADAARSVLAAHPDTPALAFARALLDAREGRPAAAIPVLQRLSQSEDRDLRARAVRQLVELRLAAGQLDARRAADALDALMYSWRGDDRELDLRLREADLRARAGDFRGALSHLREAADPVLAEGWPDRVAMLHGRMVDTFARAVAESSGSGAPPLAFVAMVEDNADLLPSGPAGEAIAERVADGLAALDLPDQAAARLAKLVERAPVGAARAMLGARLAQARLDQGDPQAALTALSASTADPLAPALSELRTLIYGRATAARGDLPAATGALDALGTPGAQRLRAQLLQNAGHWDDAALAWRRLAQQTLPATGPLDAAQTGLLLNVATAAAQAGDQGALDWVRARDLSRAAPGRDAELLRVLAAPPVHAFGDLPRVSAELVAARQVAAAPSPAAAAAAAPAAEAPSSR